MFGSNKFKVLAIVTHFLVNLCTKDGFGEYHKVTANMSIQILSAPCLHGILFAGVDFHTGIWFFITCTVVHRTSLWDAGSLETGGM